MHCCADMRPSQDSDQLKLCSHAFALVLTVCTQHSLEVPAVTAVANTYCRLKLDALALLKALT